MDGKRAKAARKRKPIKECPNPLFLKWLERWRDEAIAKESKLEYVYSKAITSLKKYPLPLESGKEATILDGIGPSISKRLDEELEKHRRLQNNVVIDQGDSDIIDVGFTDMKVPPPPPQNILPTSPNTVTISLTDTLEPKPKKKRKSSPKEYIPVYRSGPYAILITLLRASERIGYKGYLTKKELQEQAQPHSETSFTVPEPDSYYTAWSSMSTLIKKGLVSKSGSPARFSLTDSGYVLADKLTTATASHNANTRSPCNVPQFSPPSTPTSRAAPKPRTPTAFATPPTAKSRTTLSPVSTSQVNSNSHECETSSKSLYGKPSKDFLAAYRYKTSGTEAKSFYLGSLRFWYVGSDGKCVEHQDKAAVIVDDDISFGYLVKCKQSELDKTDIKYKQDHSRQGKDDHVFVYIDSQSFEEQRALSETSVKKRSIGNSLSASSDDSDEEMFMRPLFERLTVPRNDSIESTKTAASVSVRIPEVISITDISQTAVVSSGKPDYGVKAISSNVLFQTSVSMANELNQGELLDKKQSSQTKISKQTKQEKRQVTKQDIQAKQRASEESNAPKLSTQPNQPKLPTNCRLVPEKLRENQASIPSTSERVVSEDIVRVIESDEPNKVEKIVIPEYELKTGSFEIILCVDFVETTGGSKTVRKEEMVKELRKNGICFDVRKLNVGDFLWIAREKTSPIPGQLVLPERRELVLDYIVERKRMDDLCSSIKDGRFKEQKFRLLNSGLRHPVYLVEDFGSMNFMSMPVQTLEQAMINTQIGQEFFVKRTRDIKASAAYLTLMTRYLQTVYENQTLKAIKKDDMAFVENEEVNTFLMTFNELNDISVKNRVLTVGELFGKQLLQIPGVAAEKVVGILEHYPTLRDLLDAYENLTTNKEKENLLSDIKFGKTRRKIGPSVSKTVYQLYCTKGALS